MSRPVLGLRLDDDAKARAEARLGQARTQEAAGSRVERAKRAIHEMRRRWPVVFDPRNPLPLKVGIRHDLKAAMPETSGVVLSAAITMMVRRVEYHEAVVEHRQRYDLSGAVVGEVSPDDIEHHRSWAKKLRAKRRR